MFMAITQALVKAKASKGLSPEKVLRSINEDLSMDNASLMFVTLFIGILDTKTGEVIYCNGGHNHPYLIPSGDYIKSVETTNGIALGVDGDISFKSKRFFLKKGDIIFLYTDGVTEAMNKKEELFSQERLEHCVSALRDRPLEKIVFGIMREVRSFSHEVEQTDDITILILKYKGASA